MTFTKYLTALAMLSFATSAFAQNGEYVTVRDLESWASLNLKYKASKKWSIKLEQQFRFGNNSTQIDDYITELSTNYDFGKYIFGGVGFRYAGQPDRVGANQDFEHYFRFHIDLGVKHAVQRFNFKYRLRYQLKDQIGVSKEEGDYANNHLRLKINVGYNIKKWKFDPEISAEIFHHFEKGEQNGFNKFRLTVGTQYKTKSWGKIGLFYRIEQELIAPYPKTTHIIGLKYTYTLKNKNKKEDNTTWY
jgi:hypothetical protein